MPRYRVHLYPVMRLVYEIDAASPKQAICEAESLLADEAWRSAIEIDYAGDQNTGAIVDRVEPDTHDEAYREWFYELVPVRTCGGK